MSEFAQFIAVGDRTFTLPDPQGANEKAFRFPLPDLNQARSAVVMFKVSAHGQVRLLMRFTGHENQFVDQQFQAANSELEVPRSWHEILPGIDLDAANNELVVSVSTDGGGSVDLSDIVILYHGSLSP
jgi:hypothetical protein